MEETPSRIAVYLDFENLVISQYDATYGRGSWQADRPARAHVGGPLKEKLRAAQLDVSAVVDYAASVGVVTVCRAYANWSAPAFGDYGQVLTSRSVDLVQLFPLAGSKNGADIRLATDVIDDLARFPHLTHVLVAAGDSDYLAVAQKARRLGKQVVGVGVEGSIGRYWEAACDEFKRYDALLKTGSGGAGEGVPGEEATSPEEVLVRALRLCEQQRGSERIPLPVLKQVMRRLSPGFDEQALGHKNFSGFLLANRTVVSTDGSRNYAWPATAGGAVATRTVPPPAPKGPVDECRAGLPFISPATWPLSSSTQAQVVQAVRTIWTVLGGEAVDTLPHPEWQQQLLAAGMDATSATRARSFALQIVGVTTRADEGGWVANPELSHATDEEISLRLRRGIVLRMHLHCPDASIDQLAEAVHGPHPTVGEKALCEAVVRELAEASAPPAGPSAGTS